jgi:hypothetical protein
MRFFRRRSGWDTLQRLYREAERDAKQGGEAVARALSVPAVFALLATMGKTREDLADIYRYMRSTGQPGDRCDVAICNPHLLRHYFSEEQRTGRTEDLYIAVAAWIALDPGSSTYPARQTVNWRSFIPMPADVRQYESFIQRAAVHVDDVVEFSAALIGGPLSVSHPDTQRARASALAAADHLAPLIFEFIHTGILGDPDLSLSAYGREMNFRFRFARHADPTVVADLALLFELLFLAGMFVHYRLYQYPTRGDLSQVDILSLQKKWALAAIDADQRLLTYAQDFEQLPPVIAKALYQRRVEPFLEAHVGFGWAKRSRVESFVNNILFAGILLAMMADLETG